MPAPVPTKSAPPARKKTSGRPERAPSNPPPSPITLRSDLLEALRERAPKTAHVSELCVALNVPKAARNDVENMLTSLREDGWIQELPGRRYRLAKKRPRPAVPAPVARAPVPTRRDKKSDQSSKGRHKGAEYAGAARRGRGSGPRGGSTSHVGRLSMNARGFGFVSLPGPDGDAFINPGNLNGALHGDEVEVNLWKTPKGLEGAVRSVVKRGNTRVVGVLRRLGVDFVLESEDPRLPGTMEVGGELPPNTDEGKIVVAEITRYASDGDSPEVKILSVLGRPGVAAVEIAAIKARENIVEEFPEDVVAEAESFGTEVSPRDSRGREDLRNLDLVTIDPADARDHDDAVWAEALIGGGWRLIVAIADVSHYVTEGSALDREARSRGCSIYLPDRAIPMLPHQLSSHLASLLPDVDRLCMCAEIQITQRGEVASYRLFEGVMRLAGGLTYDGVARALGLTEVPARDPRAEELLPLLETLRDLSAALRAKRKRRGSIDFDLPEARVKLDEATGEPIEVYASRVDPGIRASYRIVEDLMLVANEVVAEDFAKAGAPTIYRIHGVPDPAKIERLSAVAAAFGHQLDEDFGKDPKGLALFLEETADEPHASALGYMALRSMQQAQYSTNNVGHFGLAAEHYLHFTSPIRRYPDMIVHRVLRARLQAGSRARNKKVAEEVGTELQAMALDSSRLERRAMEVEREALDLYRALFMRARLGQVFDAKITGFAGRNLVASIESPFVDVIVALGDESGERFELDELGLRLVGDSGQSFALGDKIRVRVTAIRIGERRVTGQLLSAGQTSSGTQKAPLQEGDDGYVPGPRRFQRSEIGGKSQPPRGFGKGGKPGKDNKPRKGSGKGPIRSEGPPKVQLGRNGVAPASASGGWKSGTGSGSGDRPFDKRGKKSKRRR